MKTFAVAAALGAYLVTGGCTDALAQVRAISVEPGVAENVDWSRLTKDETVTQAAIALARISENYRSSFESAIDASAFLEPVFNATLSQVLALRDAIASNPYVRISSFDITVTWPPSVSVEFSFPPVVGPDNKAP